MTQKILRWIDSHSPTPAQASDPDYLEALIQEYADAHCSPLEGDEVAVLIWLYQVHASKRTTQNLPA